MRSWSDGDRRPIVSEIQAAAVAQASWARSLVRSASVAKLPPSSTAHQTIVGPLKIRELMLKFPHSTTTDVTGTVRL
jgi:hypothetical protein